MLGFGILMFFFFFQAEDGIRDVAVTGVQTCALPISAGGTKQQPPGEAPSATTQRTNTEEREPRRRGDEFDRRSEHSPERGARAQCGNGSSQRERIGP